ncbi:hypothetical protein [Pontixanthobacter aquaemixtae]|uniref:Transmembrane protein n=1 Tax=Pontixanthobacter aquaemixtae TaxID=1958940 RepID=A0A844ZU01_9SPHN|nr:hypothetical protein [Pontixanthobacter aquaemixtae]MXO91781.1 hypothetical protein [Pontixanthobacter aquaemixtae]
MNTREFLLTVPLVWVLVFWLLNIVLIALIKVYRPVERGRKAPFYAKILTFFALSLPLFVAFRVTSGTIQQASFLLSAGTLLGVSFGGIFLGSVISKAIIFALGREPQPRRGSNARDKGEEVLLDGKPLDELE